MAVRQRLIHRPPAAVWAVLENQDLYEQWVIGAAESRPGEGRWPELGSSLTYSLHIGPKAFESRTVVRRVEKPHILELEADGGPLGTARIAFDIRSWGENTLVIFDEHPLRGVGGALHNAVLDWGLQLRNRAMLARFAELVEEVTPAASEADTADAGR